MILILFCSWPVEKNANWAVAHYHFEIGNHHLVKRKQWVIYAYCPIRPLIIPSGQQYDGCMQVAVIGNGSSDGILWGVQNHSEIFSVCWGEKPVFGMWENWTILVWFQLINIIHTHIPVQNYDICPQTLVDESGRRAVWCPCSWPTENSIYVLVYYNPQYHFHHSKWSALWGPSH